MLKRYLLEKVQQWINSLLEAERDEFLGRDRQQRLDENRDNYRNGYRPRKLNLLGLGGLELRVPRDRKGEFHSAWLPERKGQDGELEAFLAEAFLAGLSTRDLARISEKHLGHKYDSKQVSRIVARATEDLESWRQRSLADTVYKFLYLDGTKLSGTDQRACQPPKFLCCARCERRKRMLRSVSDRDGRSRKDGFVGERVSQSGGSADCGTKRWSWALWTAYPA